MKKTLNTIALILICAVASAQNYHVGLGIRLGGLTSGLTVKGFVNEHSALEGIASFGNKSFITTGLYERHFPIPSVAGLQWMIGGGGHFGFFDYGGKYFYYNDKGKRIYVTEVGHSATVGGADFIIGIEYKFNKVPFVIGSDLKPFIDFYNSGAYGYFDGAFNFRFVF